MKFLCFILCVAVALAVVESQGVPTKQCPPGEHSVLDCSTKAEPNCDNITVRPRPPCGVPQCYCDEPKVRDLSTGECVERGQCCK